MVDRHVTLKFLRDKTTGIVLSGGGVKGASHIGVLQALLEFGIEPMVVSGASAGALVGALYAKGLVPLDILRFFRDTPLFRYNLVSIQKPGFFDTERYQQFLETYIPENTFEALSRKLYIVATNLQKGEITYFSKGNLLLPLLASAALPPVFSPVLINNELYSDGAIMNNFPVEPLVSHADYIIGSYTSIAEPMHAAQITTALKLTTRVNSLMIHANALHSLRLCDVLFQPSHLNKVGVLDKKGLDKAYQIGYDHAMFTLDRIFETQV